MEPKYVITKAVIGIKMYLTRDGWLGGIEDRKKLMYTASDAQTVVTALRYLDNGNAFIFSEG